MYPWSCVDKFYTLAILRSVTKNFSEPGTFKIFLIENGDLVKRGRPLEFIKRIDVSGNILCSANSLCQK